MTVERLDTMRPSDWPSVRRAYQEGIATGNATFTASPPEIWEDWFEGKIASCCLVARDHGGGVAGWVSLEPTSRRAVYSGVALVNIYVSAACRATGVGSALLSSAITRSEEQGIWTLEARIFPENEASLRLHVSHGFRVVGVRERLGLMQFGPLKETWRDVLLLERRSGVVGSD